MKRKLKYGLFIILLKAGFTEKASAQSPFPCMGSELVVNGDFSSGNTGFTNGYSYTSSNNLEGQYYVSNSVSSWNGGMVCSGDHTSGSGNYLMLNGSPTTGASAWCETIAVTANTDYVFSAWATPFNSSPPSAYLQLYINGVKIGSLFNVGVNTNAWIQMSALWNSGSNTSASICIVDMDNSIAANDFGLDDISFKASTSAKIRNLSSVYCFSDPAVNILGTPPGGTFSGPGVSGNTFTPSVAGVGGPYHIIYSYTDASACSSKDTADVVVQGTFSISAGPNATVCSGALTQLTAAGGVNYVWSPSNGLSCISCQNPMASPLVTTTYFVSEPSDIYKQDGTSRNHAAKTCKTILDQGYSTGNGYYWIDPDGGSLSNAFPVFCDMTTDGGGWTKVTRTVTATEVNLILGSSGQQMAKCTDASSNYIASPITPVRWSWTARQVVSGNWDVNGTPASCDSAAEFYQNLGSCSNSTMGFGIGCSNGGGTQNKFYPGEADAGGGCNDSVAHTNLTFSQPCAGTSSAANAHYHFYVRSTDVSPTVVNCSSQGVVTIMINTPAMVVNPASASICAGSNVSMTVGGADVYTWSPSATLSSTTGSSVIATPTATIFYVVSGTSLTSGCSGSKNIKITVSSLPTAVISGNNSVCTGNNTSLSASGGGQYLWSTGATSATIGVTPVFPSTTYTLTATNAAGCSNSKSIAVTVYPLPTIAASGSQTVCVGNSAQLSATGATKYVWSNGATGSPVTIHPGGSATYSVTGTDVNGCVGSATSVVTLSPVVATSGNATINLGETATLSVVSNGTGYVWTPASTLSCSTCPITTASPPATTKYVVTITDNNGCSIEDTIVVTVLVVEKKCNVDIFVPDAFSPNGDNQNDVLYPRAKDNSCIKNLTFEIYDRWGSKVFQSTDITRGWDGKVSGNEYATAVFVYKLQATMTDGTVLNKKGNISLIR